MINKLMLLAALLVSVTTMAQNRETQTLTVCDGTNKSMWMPIYTGDNVNQMSTTYPHKNQFIIPASELTAMNGGSISKIAFHLASSTGNTADFCNNSTYKIYFLEVDYTTLNGYKQEGEGATATKVYEGRLNINNVGELSFGGADAAENYIYMGGNLMVTITKNHVYAYGSSTKHNTNFYGQATGQNTSWQIIYKNTSGGTDLNRALQFLPKTTFTYEPGATRYPITATANPTAGGTITGTGSYASGESCTLEATANEGYTFTNWTKDNTEVSTDVSYTFTVNESAAYVANFTVNSYEITATASPMAGGTVTGDGTYNHGASCTLTATGNTGYTFLNWTEGNEVVSTEASYTFTVSGQRTLVANFGATYSITATANPTVGGSITGAGTYANGASCTLTATSNTGYTFTNWTKNGTVVSTSASHQFTVNEETAGAYVANFAINTYTVSVSANPSNGGTVTGGGTYNYGTSCTVTATANSASDYSFTSWTDNGIVVSYNASYTISNIIGSHTLVANFTRTCPIPTDLAVVENSVTTNSASLSWTGNKESYNVRYRTISITETTDPTTEDFSGYTASTSTTNYNEADKPSDWAYWSSNAYYGPIVSNNSVLNGGISAMSNQGNFLYMNSYAVCYAVMPRMDNLSVASFKYACMFESSSMGGTFKVGYVTNTSDITGTFTAFTDVSTPRTKTLTTVTLTTDDIDILNNTEGARLAFYFSPSNNSIAIDDITVTYPHSIVDAGEWVYQNNVTSPASLSNLSPTTTYEVQVQSVCDEDFESDWSESVSFTTLSGYTIAATANPTEGGSITGAGTYNNGATCTLMATPATDYRFVNWTEGGNEVSTNASYSFAVNANRTLVANFAVNAFTVSVSANPSEGGTVSGGGTYSYGASATVTATPATGYRFVNWTENGNQISTNANYTLDNIADNHSLMANFEVAAIVTLTTSVSPVEGGYITTSPVSTIGTETIGSTNSGPNVISPYLTVPNYSFQECVYLASEIPGSSQRTITSISYYITQAQQGIAAQSDHIEVYMKNTSLSCFTEDGLGYPVYESVTVSDKVYDGMLYLPREAGWITIILDTPFVYDGTSNLMIGIHENTPETTNSRSFLFTDTSENTNISWYSYDEDMDPTDDTSLSEPYYLKQRATVRFGFGTYYQGDNVELTAHANPGYVFTNWTIDGVAAGNNNPYTITMDDSHNVIANFMMTKTFTNAGGDNLWSNAANWEPSGVPNGIDVVIAAAATISNDVVASVNNISFNGGSITIEDGGQLKHNNNGVVVTTEKVITGYGHENYQTNKGYYLISSPVNGISYSNVSGLVTTEYDLYSFESDHTESNGDLTEWVMVNGNLVANKGYLYASEGNTTLAVTGAVAHSATPIVETLTYNSGYRFGGWNLVGNPFVCNAYVTSSSNEMNYYMLNHTADYDEFITASSSDPIAPMEGLMVQATAANQTITFSRIEPSKGSGILNMDVHKTSVRGIATLDRARVRFGEGTNLEKFQLNPRHTKISIAEGSNEYSVYYADGAGTIPVNFKAEDNSRYTLDFSTEEIGFNYLHLIDNMNGNDVDLLETPYYAFDAKSTDYANRFTLVFATGNNDNESTFAFFNNGAWIINNPSTGSGQAATLQVVDALGRILSSETISGSCSKAINATPGVYMLRLINGDNVKVQKIIVNR